MGPIPPLCLIWVGARVVPLTMLGFKTPYPVNFPLESYFFVVRFAIIKV